MKEKENAGISIIGGTGFIGNHLVNFLIKKKFKKIKVLTRKLQSSTENSNVVLVEGDLLSKPSIEKLVKNQDIVINLAYIPNNYQANINAAEILVNSCIKLGVSRLVHCSTAIVSGRVRSQIINEETTCRPFNEYEKTKLAIEEKLLLLAKDKIELIILRPTAVFGYGGMNLVKTLNSIICQSKVINFFRIMLNKFRYMHLVPVESVINAIYYLSTTSKNLSGEKFIISSDDEKNNNYFYVANRTLSISNQANFKKIFIPFSYFFLKIILKFLKKSQIDPTQIYSNEKLKNLGFNNNVNFEAAVDEFITSQLNS